MKVAIVVPDDRDEKRQYEAPEPLFGTAVTALLEGFARTPEIEVHIVSCTQRPLRAPPQLEKNIYYHSALVPKWGWMRGAFVGCVRAVRQQLNEIKPQIVHGQGTERYCGISAVFSGVPNVITIHGNMRKIAELLRPKPFSYGWLAAKLERVVLLRTNGVFCNSSYTRQHVAVYTKKTWLVPNPLRLRFFGPPRVGASEAPIILNIGIIGPRKSQCAVLDLAQRLYQRGARFEAHFIGRLPPNDLYGTAFQQRMAQAEKLGYARYLGEKSEPELIDLFDSASALLHIPIEESFGLVAIEALARNLKFFGSRVGGLIDIAAGVRGAELFDLEDHAGLDNALAEWLRRGHPKLIDAADQMQKRYHPLVIARRHIEIYHEILATRPN